MRKLPALKLQSLKLKAQCEPKRGKPQNVKVHVFMLDAVWLLNGQNQAGKRSR